MPFVMIDIFLLPPLITFIDLFLIFLIGTFDTIIIDLNNFDFIAFQQNA